MHKIVLDLQ